MDDRPFIIPPDLAIKTVGRCIWCDGAPPDVELRNEHIIPNSFGGHRYIQNGCCRQCEKDQSAYIGKVCDLALAGLRYHHGFPVSKKKRLSNRTLRISTGNANVLTVPQHEAPGLISLPVFKIPRILTGVYEIVNAIPLAGFYVRSTTDDASERQKKLETSGIAKALSYNETPLAEFIRVLAHIGHGYFMAQEKITIGVSH